MSPAFQQSHSSNRLCFLSLRTKSVFITKTLIFKLIKMLLHSLRQAAHPIKHYGVDFVIQKKKKNFTRQCAFKGTLSRWVYCILRQNSDWVPSLVQKML